MIGDAVGLAVASARRMREAVTTALTIRDGRAPQEIPNGSVTTPLLHDMFRRLNRTVSRGRPPVCRHVDPRTYRGQVLTWHPWYRKDEVKCASCVARAAKKIENTPENETCDGCRGHPATLFPFVCVTPPQAVAHEGRTFLLAPPITVYIHLCANCVEAEKGLST